MHRKSFKIAYDYKSRITLIVIILSFNFVWPQDTQKKKYNSESDSLWSHYTYLHKISPNGKWVVIHDLFHNKENEVILQNTSNLTSFTLKDCKAIEFSNNNKWFAGFIGKEELIIIDLLKNDKKVYEGIEPQELSFSASGEHLALYNKDSENNKNLNIINLESQKTKVIADVTEFKWHPSKDKLLIIRGEQKSVEQYNAINDKSETVINCLDGFFTNLQWTDSNEAVFLKNQNNRTSIMFLNSEGEIKSLENEIITEFQKEFKISKIQPIGSRDGKKVFFYRERMHGIDDKEKYLFSDVEIWNSKDPWIQPRMQSYQENKLNFLLTAWFPKTNKVIAIETEQTPTSALDTDHDFALVYNKLDYEPLYKFFPNADLYSKNFQTGEVNLITKNQYTEEKFITISPEGKYISFFKDNNWWIYSIKQKTILNLTEDLPINFENNDLNYRNVIYPHGNPGWLNNDTYIILYDKYDIWKISSDGKEKIRLTRGREDEIIYRLLKEPKRTIGPSFGSTSYNENKPLVIEIFDKKNNKSGLALLQKNDSIQTIIFEDQKIDNILIAKDFSKIFYRKQKYNFPKAIYKINLNERNESLIFQSNRELLYYDFGKVEFLQYPGLNQELLTGALVYPSNYDSSKKYPLIVQIYEKESRQVNIFEPPSDYGINQFNLLKYITNGYFVFYPDFNFEIGNPGGSAVKCLSSAMKKVLENDNIDKNKIGLIGHSFGGYETAFIISQTDMFATAVAGAPVTDLIDFYHSIFWGFNINQLWRMESQQFRMGTSFYKSKNDYYKNSAFHNIENINTPLLLWSGKLDSNINWHQSVKLFMGLKRLNKKAKMLLFNNESHNLMKPENQKILSQEVFNWMECFLK